MNIDYFNPPSEPLVELLGNFPEDSFLIMEDVLESKRSFRFIYQKMIDIMKYGFNEEPIRHYPVKFKFKREDMKIHILEMNKFIYNMVFWYGFMDMGRSDLLTEKYLIDPSIMDIGNVTKWIDENIVAQHPGDILSKNKTIDEIRHNQAAIAKAFSLQMALNVSIRDVIIAAEENPRINELIHYRLDEKMQPSDIEAQISKDAKEMVSLFKQSNTGYAPLLRAGKNLSEGQFREIMMVIALKSNINGQPIPVVVNTNFLVDGLYKPSYIYTSAQGARKALILSKKYMSVPGAFSKKINLASTSASILRQDNEPCDSVAYVEYEIINKNFLKLLDRRYYYDEMGVMKELHYEEDEDLIGKKIRFRSPCTCNSKDGVCKYCYGSLYDINKDLFSAGSFAATKNSEPLGQKVLSAKHEQNTDSGLIGFNEEFNNFFELASTEVTLLENVENTDNLAIILDDIDVEEIGDEEHYFVKKFSLLDESTGVIYSFKENKDSKLYLSTQLTEYYKHRKPKDRDKPFPLGLFVGDDGDVPLFMVEVESVEVTEPIKIIESVLNNPKDRSDISGICQATAEAFTSIGINYNFVHIEMIIRGLVRRKTDDTQRPDFSRTGNHKDAQVLNVNMSLKHNPSALVTLSYGYVRQVLTSASFYKKSEPSHLDPLWVDQLSRYIDQ